MEEKCFIIDKNNKVYEDYFKWWNNKENLLNKWERFKKLTGIEAECFVPQRSLYIVPTQNDLNKFRTMLRKEVFKDGLRQFKANSKLQKDWERFIDNEKVLVSKPNIILDFIGKYSSGRMTSRLFHYKNNVYCSISGDFYSDKIPNGYNEIKKSEFYKIIELIEEGKDKC